MRVILAIRCDLYGARLGRKYTESSAKIKMKETSASVSFVYLSQDRETSDCYILKLLRNVRTLRAEHHSESAFVLSSHRIFDGEELRRVKPLKTVVLGKRAVNCYKETQTAEVTIFDRPQQLLHFSQCRRLEALTRE